MGDGVSLADVLAIPEGDPLAGWPAGEADDGNDDAPGRLDAGAPRAAAECPAGRARAALAGDGRDDGAFLAGVLTAGVGTVVAGEGTVGAGTVVAGTDVAGVDAGAGVAVGGGASRWQAAMTTVLPDRTALPPMPLTSAK